MYPWHGSPPATELPLHQQSLEGIDGNVYDSIAGTVNTFVWSELNPLTDYEVYVFGLETSPGTVDIRMTGEGAPETFTQNYTGNQLFINGELGDSSRDLSSFAVIVTSSSTGTITIESTLVQGYVGTAGLALRERGVSIPQSLPYVQDFDSGLPGQADGWEYYSDIEGSILELGGRLRLHDVVEGSATSLNEALLHVDLSAVTGPVKLILDHWSLDDENHAMPNGSFQGHTHGDGIALSVDGEHWVTVSDLTTDVTGQVLYLDAALLQAQADAASQDLSDVRIKLQQYDDSSADSNGREFDTIRVETPVMFDDPNLKAAIEAELAISDPTPTEMLGLIRLDAGQQNISSLTGLDYAANLTVLNLGDNQLTDITALSDLTQLTELDLGGNQLTDGTALSELTHLTQLEVDDNQFTHITLSRLINLKDLRLENNQLTHVSLTGLTRLGYLYLSHNPLTDVTFSELTTLGYLSLSHTHLTDINALSELTHLVSLTLSHNALTDVTPLSGLTYLDYLDLSNNALTDITPLSTLTYLGYLDLSTNTLNQAAYTTNIPVLQLNNPGIDLAYDAPGRIEGHVWHDHYRNGVWDVEEQGLAGWTVYLDQDQDGILDAGEPSVITGTDGAYVIEFLSTQTYHVAEILQPGWLGTYPTTVSHEINLGIDQTLTDIHFGNAPSVTPELLPASQYFGAGLPGVSQGWEYYSDNHGRIQVVDGRLRLDDSATSDYSLNEAILHVDLTGSATGYLTLDHINLGDEKHLMPIGSFTDHVNGDGIAVSVDGIHWVTLVSLSEDFTEKTFNLAATLAQAQADANSADLSDVRIKLQQYDNGKAPTDGRAFDNIKVTATSPVVPQTPGYRQDFNNGLPVGTQGWEYYSDNHGRIQVVDGRLRLDDSATSDYSLNEAILHLDLTGTGTVSLTLDHISLGDEKHTMPLGSFTGHANGDGIAVSVDGVRWVTVVGLDDDFTNRTFSLDAALTQALLDANLTDLSDVRIKFQQYDNGKAPYDGREFENIRITIPQLPGYNQDFAGGLPSGREGWEYYSDNHGRIQVVDERLRMDDSATSDYSLNEAVLHMNLTDTNTVNLTLDYDSLGDEKHAMPVGSFTGHVMGDGIAASVDGIHWVTVVSLTGDITGQIFNLDMALAQAQIDAGSTNLADVHIKFQQYDNSKTPYDGCEFDHIMVTATEPAMVPQLPGYAQDFTNGLPGMSAGWEYYSDNHGRIQVVDGRLRLDDSATGDYSLNEAILHLDLTGISTVSLTLDHISLGDENHAMPVGSFTGHSNGDGIAVSVDGIHWVTVTSLDEDFTNQTFSLDAALAQALLDANLSDLSDVRIKFQQYDNGKSPYDGREFDNLTISAQ